MKIKKIIMSLTAAALPLAAMNSSAVDVELSGNTKLSIGGYIKADALWTDYQDGAPNGPGTAERILIPSAIPVGNDAASESAQLDTSISTSRINFKTVTDSDVGKLVSFLEIDFLSGGGNEVVSNSTNPRIRHAFIDWHYNASSSLLIGQTWGTFFNVGALPEAVDFIGPTSGTVFNRQFMVRWTKKLGGGASFMLSAENPDSGFVDGGSGIAGSAFDDNQFPDIVARFNGKVGGLSYSLAGIVREIAYEDGTFEEDKFSGAVSFSGKWVLPNNDNINFMLSSGTLGRYMALGAYRDGAIDAGGNLDLTNVTGLYVTYRHFWTPKLRSTAMFAYSKADLADGAAATNTEKLMNYNINLMYSPTKKLSFGGAYIHAERELENGTDGDLDRLQFTAKYVF